MNKKHIIIWTNVYIIYDFIFRINHNMINFDWQNLLPCKYILYFIIILCY